MRRPVRTPDSSNRLWRVAPAGCLIIAVISAGWSATRSPAEAAQVVEREATAEVYQRDCAWCHGIDGEGTRRGPELTGVGLALVDYMVRTGRMPIDDPNERLARSTPAYDPATTEALVAYVGELQDGAVADGPGIPDVDPAAGDVATGAEVWRHQCAACHAWSGTGGGMLERAAPDVRGIPPIEMAEAVRAGPLAMPRFDEVAVSQQELDSLAAFFEDELADPKDPGGWPLGHIGPVAEGALAVVVGLGLLGVAARLIGAGREHR